MITFFLVSALAHAESDTPRCDVADGAGHHLCEASGPGWAVHSGVLTGVDVARGEIVVEEAREGRVVVDEVKVDNTWLLPALTAGGTVLVYEDQHGVNVAAAR